jgi:hypothetical protein
VNIPGNLLEILIHIHQIRLVTPLVKMASPVMLPIIIHIFFFFAIQDDQGKETKLVNECGV